MMELTHRLAVTKLGDGQADGVSEEERQAIGEWAARLSNGQVHRLWQLLLKGYDEVRGAPDPLVAAQMALLRVLHAAEMPDPGKLARAIEQAAANGLSGAASAPATAGQGGAPSASMPSPEIEWSILCDRVEQEGLLRVGQIMRDWVRIIELRHGRLVFTTSDDFLEDVVPDLRDALLRATDERWEVERGQGEAAPSLREREEAAKAAELERIRNHPLVKSALAAFPGAEFANEEDAPVGDRNWGRRA